jgi:hypothetical protein
MCIIAMIPTKAQRPGLDILEQCWRSNPDGAGLMYPNQERNILVVDKGHMTLTALKEAWAKVPEGVPVCVHFRIKTHGPKDPANTHPHVVHPDEVAIVHNGILPIGAPANSPESDTARFARLVLSNFPKTWWKNDAMVHLVEEYMGRGNKMIAMNASGSFRILNESAGTWEQGVWFSNQTFRVSRSYQGSYGYSRSNTWSEGYDGYQEWAGTPRGGGWHQAQQARNKAAAPVSTPEPVGTSEAHPGAAQSVPGAEETQVIEPELIELDVPNDPVVMAVASGAISEENMRLLSLDIGTMTDHEFQQYEMLMEELSHG